MKTAFTVLSVVLLSAAVARAQPAPVLMSVTSADKAKGEVVLREIVLTNINGQIVAEEHKSEIDITACRVITPDGKQVPNDDLWKRLKNNIVVVVSLSEQAPAQPFLRAVNAETLVIIPPAPRNVAPQENVK